MGKKTTAKVESIERDLMESGQLAVEVREGENVYYIDAWSYSAILLFLSNALAFKKKYLLRIFDDLSGVAWTVGKACHDALRMYYGCGNTREEAITAGYAYLDMVRDEEIDYGKEGTREKMLARYAQAVKFYFAEEPKFHKILSVEEPTVTYLEIGGQRGALPIKCVPDLVVQAEDGEIDIVDHKFVSAYSDFEEENARHIVQAMCNYYPVLAWLQQRGIDKKPRSIIFNECKVSENSGPNKGKAQIQPYAITYADHPEYFTFFENLYNDVTAELLRPDKKYLPNLSDHLDGNMTFTLYKNEIIGAEAPVAVAAKTRDVKFMEKRFVRSAVDKVENASLTNEERVRIKLLDLGLPVEMQQTIVGANVTRYTMKPARGVRMASVEKFAKDLAYALKAKSIRIEAPIAGTDLVGVEVPSEKRQYFQATSGMFGLVPNSTNIPVGVDVCGNVVVKPLEDMPHLLVAGSTGSGKSVMINVVINALMWQNSVEDLKLVLIDPKRVELAPYRNSPYLMGQVIYDEMKARRALHWLIGEMEHRYEQLEAAGVRNLAEYNAGNTEHMPRIVAVIDEFADLILQTKDEKRDNRRRDKYTTAARGKASKVKGIGDDTPADELPDTERMIVRLAQKARAVGIHLVLGTQRPSVDVVTGLIKANLPTRVAFMTASRVDSQVILDVAGAEQLLGKGDMLFMDPHTRGLQRLQSFYV